ncbi:MAG: translation initiation factor IF-3 [Candidatus Sungbacteria bacterium]|nr:translation initiation factor IF-3 [Candidatus Sungbacteria bacterium]
MFSLCLMPDPFGPHSARYPFLTSFSIQRRYRINQFIRTSPIRVIGEDGKNLGVMETAQALRIANEQELDLIEIAPTVSPPVCRIMDFGKFKYEREKGEREHGKKQKDVSEVKGIRIGFTTGKHDLEMRALQIKKFLEEGHKVRIDMKLAGRQRAHADLAMERFKLFLDVIPTEFTLELPPKKLPHGFIAVITKK